MVLCLLGSRRGRIGMRPRYAEMDREGFAGLDVGERREYMGSSTQVLELQGFELHFWPYLQRVHVVSYLAWQL